MALLIIDLKILGLNGKKKTEYMSVFLVKCQNEKYYYFRIIIMHPCLVCQNSILLAPIYYIFTGGDTEK